MLVNKLIMSYKKKCLYNESLRIIPAFVSADKLEITHAITATSVRKHSEYIYVIRYINIRNSETFVCFVGKHAQKFNVKLSEKYKINL